MTPRLPPLLLLLLCVAVPFLCAVASSGGADDSPEPASAPCGPEDEDCADEAAGDALLQHRAVREAASLEASEEEPEVALQEKLEAMLGRAATTAAHQQRSRGQKKGSETFEGCRLWARRHGGADEQSPALKDISATQRDGSGAAQACQNNEVLLLKEGFSDMTTQCCPIGSRSCAGCEELASDGTCASCVGGYQLSAGHCTACIDSAGWVNDKGDACHKASCDDKKHHGLSSNMACCKCGGGLPVATPFIFPVVSLVLGDTTVPAEHFPVPRTAAKYSVNTACELAKYGLSIDSATGGVGLAKPGCGKVGCDSHEPIRIECVITAHQTPTLNATATLLVMATPFSYAQNPLVVRPGSETFSPLVTATQATMSCVPNDMSSWVSIDGAGTITASPAGLSSKGGVTGMPTLGIVGGRCTVTATVGGNTAHTDVLVFAPQVWQSFTYPATRVFATVGEAAAPMKIVVADKERLKPNRFSIYCNPDVPATFAFDTVTGVGTVDGHLALTLDTSTGVLHVAPSKALEKTIDDLISDDRARKTIALACKVHGFYVEQARMDPRTVSSPELRIELRDNACWVQRTEDFAGRTKRLAGATVQECWRECRKDVTCTDFSWKGDADTGKCYFYDGFCDGKDLCPIRNQAVYTKISGCGERSSCLKLDDVNHWWVDGVYCPAGESTYGPIYLKVGNTVADTLYLSLYDASRDGTVAGCSPGMYALKRVAPGKDFADPGSDYIELKGTTEKCVGEAAVDFVDNIFTDGRVSLDNITAEVVGQSCGKPNITTDTSDEEGEEEPGVPAIILDDPSTSDPADFWMHPCDCFPERWGATTPVTDDSFEAVPAGSDNIYQPPPFVIVHGQFTCESEFIMGGVIVLLEEQTCEVFCREAQCNYFWEGEVGSIKQCRLYSECTLLVRENGINGKLVGMPETGKELCRVADPEKCWAVSGRRGLLKANAPEDRVDCEWRDLIEQCDHKLLLGGYGVEKCARCTYRDPNKMKYAHKKPVPENFQHGAKVSVSCWEERFRSTLLSGGATGGESLTCVSGKWYASDGSLGLSNFACGACLQIASPPYRQLDARKKQELYFTDITEVQLKVMMKTPRVMLKAGTVDGQLDSSPGSGAKAAGSLVECQGDCDKDEDCSGIMRCFKRSGFEQVPGCDGKGIEGWAYCIVPSQELLPITKVGPGEDYDNLLAECQGHCQANSDCVSGLKCFKRSDTEPVPGCSGAGGSGWNYCYDPAKYKPIDGSPGSDGKGKLFECQGDCDRDSDCMGSLKCFQTGKRIPIVTGCIGATLKATDYCYDPSKGVRDFRNRGKDYSGSDLDVCEGNCKSDSNCKAGLKCFRRSKSDYENDDAPGCRTRPKRGYSVCYDPKAKYSVSIDNSPGGGGKRKLIECEGDCDKDSDCEGSLKCFQRHDAKSSDPQLVRGCHGSMKASSDYCYKPVSKALVNAAKPHPPALGECQGDCDTDSHCAAGLMCFKRKGLEPIPGCQGNGKSGWDYCVDAVKMQGVTLASEKLELTGLVMKTVPGVGEEKRILESTGEPGRCLEANKSLGFKGVPCATPPTPQQLVTTADLPALLEAEFKDATLGLVPPRSEMEISKTFQHASLKDFLFEQDCGEHAVSSFGFKDDDKDRKLEIFADCTRAATLGSPSELKDAVLGGELALEFTTCMASDSQTNEWIKYQFNSQPQKNLGNKGRNKGDKDKYTITYTEPFESIRIWGGNDGWKVCQIKLSGDELPNERVDLNLPSLPCWLKSNGGKDCVKAEIRITGNRMPHELAHARIECPVGQAVTYIRKKVNKIQYKCSYIAGLGACVPGQTEQVDTSSGKFDSLKDYGVVCSPGHVLQSWVAEESSGGKWLRNRYTCCANDGVPMAVVATGRRLENNLQAVEGLYCPVNRDTSGRLLFDRTHAFRDSDQGVSRSIHFDRDHGKWCVNGDQGELCVENGAAHPLDDGFAGEAWEALPVSDFDGEFIARGVAKAAGAGKKRKFPTLIEFGATQPSYAEECRDEVTPGQSDFNLEEMNKKGESLAEGNPCKLIAGEWKKEKGKGWKPSGTSTWTTHGWDNKDSERGAGTTYDSVRACGDREINRDLKAAEFQFGHDMVENTMGYIEPWFGLPCSFVPDAEVAPMGVGVEFKVSKICEGIVNFVFSTVNFMNNGVLMGQQFAMANDDNADCNSLQHGLSRIFCDLHCIRDAVKAGDKAILTSLERMVGVIGENTNLLLEYYAGTLQDSVDLISDKLGVKSSLVEAKEMTGRMQGMFMEMGKMLEGGQMAANGRATVLRALDEATAKFSKTQFPVGPNATYLFESMSQEVEKLHATVSTSTKHQLSPSEAATQRASAGLEHLQKVLRTRLHLLGVYKTRSAAANERQRRLRSKVDAADVLEEVREQSARMMLLTLDETWWSLRSHLDGYYEKAQVQAEAYDSAFALLDGYTSQCSVGFSQLQSAYRHSLAAEEAAHDQLHSTWAAVVPELGLLASKVSDGRGFVELDRLDAASIGASALGTNLSTVCAGGPEAVAAARAALDEATRDGLVEQTATQMRGVLVQAATLRDRFPAGGLQAPDLSEVTEAWQRLHSAYLEARVGRDDLAVELVERIQRNSCGGALRSSAKKV